jgi:xanthine dehydrogenase accessory factor
MTPVWRTIERFLAEHGTAAGLTLAESVGSSLREIGARVMMRPDGRFFSTTGDDAAHA